MNKEDEIKEIVEEICDDVSKERLDNSLKQLKTLIDKEGEDLPSGWRKRSGLCLNAHVPDGVMDLYLYWGGFSGNVFYPISGREDYLNNDIDKYSGEQLELRLSLAKFIVKCFEEYGNVQ